MLALFLINDADETYMAHVTQSRDNNASVIMRPRFLQDCLCEQWSRRPGR